MARLHLIQYRNYSDQTIELGRHTVFIGVNGIGKTNILEAVRTISVTKSYRVEKDRDTIQWDQAYCRLEYDDDATKIEYVVTVDDPAFKAGPSNGKKVMKIDGVLQPLTAAYGVVPTVLFSPETMELVTGSPQERRRFLDTLLSQADRSYLDALLTYRKVLRERHFVLLRLQQGLGSSDELDFWDQALVQQGTYIIEGRANLIQKLNTTLVTIYPQFLTDKTDEHLVISYEPAVEATKFVDKVKSSRGWDIKTGATRFGPHRDEVRFLLHNRDITLFASRGEIRSCVLATKLAEAIYLAEQNPNPPLLLLDDVFSELDASRRALLLELIAPYRSLITTTDEAFVAAELPGSQTYHLPFDKPATPSKTKRKSKK